MAFETEKIPAGGQSLSVQLCQQIRSYLAEYYVEQPIKEYICRSADDLQAAPKQCIRRLEEERCRASMANMGATSLEEILRQEDAGFTETLLRLIDRSGKTDPQIYKKANLSKQHFSKIRNNPRYQPTKATAIALALALELDLEETRDLIGRAGYALTNSSKFDLIIRFFIEQGKYDVMEINLALYAFDQSLLGS